MSSQRSPWRYLRDTDVLHALVIALLALVGSAGLVFVGYFIHVCRHAARAPRATGQRRVVLVFGQKLIADAPQPDYQQRLLRCRSLMCSDAAERVLLLGGLSGGQISEATAGAAWLRAQGALPDVPLVLEQASTDSLENLRNARDLLQSASPTDDTALAVTLITNRYHLARCLLLARRLGFQAWPVGAEDRLPRTPRYAALLLTEAAYLMWIDLGVRWAQLIGHQRMAARIT